MFPELTNSDIVLTNAREVHGPVVAEHVIALIFALAKKIPGSVRLQEKHIWGQQILWDEVPRVREVAGATLGLIGLGSIGRAVAKSAKALGMKVIAVREHPEKGSEGAEHRLWPQPDQRYLPPSRLHRAGRSGHRWHEGDRQRRTPRAHEAGSLPDQRWPRPAGR